MFTPPFRIPFRRPSREARQNRHAPVDLHTLVASGLPPQWPATRLSRPRPQRALWLPLRREGQSSASPYPTHPVTPDDQRPLPQPPAPGQKRQKENWENIWYIGMYGSMIVAAIGLYYKPDTRCVGRVAIACNGSLTPYPFMQHTNMGPRRGEAPDGGARRAVQVRAWRSATAVDASTCYVLISSLSFPVYHAANAIAEM